MAITKSICSWINDLVNQGNKQQEDISHMKECCKKIDYIERSVNNLYARYYNLEQDIFNNTAEIKYIKNQISHLENDCCGHHIYVEEEFPDEPPSGKEGDVLIITNNGSIYEFIDGEWICKGIISLSGGKF